MELNDFQARCMRTAVYPRQQAVTYCTLGLVSEAGEVAGKLKKYIRGDSGWDQNGMITELGDVLWYVAMLAEELDVPLDDLAAGVLSKLQARKAAGTIKGDGDNR
jgi:NTP pyrophosphatase (non-canonical NTP hydrolase)